MAARAWKIGLRMSRNFGPRAFVMDILSKLRRASQGFDSDKEESNILSSIYVGGFESMKITHK